MADIHLRRLETAITAEFHDRIDLSDLVTRSSEQRQHSFLARALASHTLRQIVPIDVEDAARCLTDGYNDNGIDAVCFDESSNRLVVCQSKWMSSGQGSPDVADIDKFLAGVVDLLNLRFDRFNERLRQQEATLRRAIADANVQITLAVTYSGSDKLSAHVQRRIEDFLATNNRPIEVFRPEILDQARLYTGLMESAASTVVDLTVHLRQWGSIDTPHLAFFGYVPACDIAEWWRLNSRRLLAKNIRDFKGRTDVNDSLADTLRVEPNLFWYFNNGITLLCKSIKKQPLGTGARDLGIFECNGVSVINGAQTVGQIGELAQRERVAAEAFVLVRLISLETCPEEFPTRVTRATNTQNSIEARDFAALDANQRRLAKEFLLDGWHYSFRAGESTPERDCGCTLQDATVALACAESELALGVLVKNQIGRVFENLETAPYTTLFNERTTAVGVRRAVEIMRTVDEYLASLSNSITPRAEAIAVHGNRFVLHFVNQDSSVLRALGRKESSEQLAATVREATVRVFEAVAHVLEKSEQNSYLQPLFRTQERCQALATQVHSELRTAAALPNASTTSVAATTKTLFPETESTQ